MTSTRQGPTALFGGVFVFHLTGKRFSLEGDVWTGPRANRLVLIGRLPQISHLEPLPSPTAPAEFSSETL